MTRSALPATRRTGRAHRHRAEAESDNNDRWLLTYADMITLLLVLFIVLFALSKIDEAKYKEFQESVSDDRVVNDSVVHGTTTHPSHGTRPAVPAPATDQLRAIEKALSQALAERGMLGDVTLSINVVGPRRRPGRRLDLLPGRLGAALPPGAPYRRRLRSGPRPVTPTTSTSPVTPTTSVITGGPYANNWELSAARATTVVERLTLVDDGRAAAGGGARLRPVPPGGAEHVARGAGTEPTGQHRREAAARQHGHGVLVSAAALGRCARLPAHEDPRPVPRPHRRHGARKLRPARHDPALDRAAPTLLTLAASRSTRSRGPKRASPSTTRCTT